VIHDAIVPVTCDNEGCKSRIEQLCWPEETLGDNSIIYLCKEVTELDFEYRGWIIINGKHYCSEECAKEAENGKG